MDSRTAIAVLSQVELFKQLDTASLAVLAGQARQLVVPKGKAVFVQDEPGDQMFVLTEGTVKLFVRFQTGEIIELVRHTPPASFGEVALVEGANRTASAEAVEEATLLTISRDDLLRLLRERPETVDTLLRSMGAIIRRTTEQVAELAFLSVQGRVARRLLLLAEGAEVQGLTQAELASMVGGSRQTVNSVLKRFEKRGFIAMAKGRVIAIHDSKRLEQLANH
jgi:CRP/FNR family cyclic AMP-dependent transcriptional regulator